MREIDPLRAACCIEACIENRSIEREIAVYKLYSGHSLRRLGCAVYSVFTLYSVYKIQRIQYTTQHPPHMPQETHNLDVYRYACLSWARLALMTQLQELSTQLLSDFVRILRVRLRACSSPRSVESEKI